MTLTAAVAAGERGNINLSADGLVMRRGSALSTNAQGLATGGNITINTGILFALENSDITANDEDSFGGRVIVNGQAIFGTAFRPQLTANNEFTIIVRGGLPPNPSELMSENMVLADFGSSSQAATDSDRVSGKGAHHYDFPPELSTTLNPSFDSTSDVIMEAQSWMLNSNGRVKLVAAALQTTPQSPWANSAQRQDF